MVNGLAGIVFTNQSWWMRLLFLHLLRPTTLIAGSRKSIEPVSKAATQQAVPSTGAEQAAVRRSPSRSAPRAAPASSFLFSNCRRPSSTRPAQGKMLMQRNACLIAVEETENDVWCRLGAGSGKCHVPKHVVSDMSDKLQRVPFQCLRLFCTPEAP